MIHEKIEIQLKNSAYKAKGHGIGLKNIRERLEMDDSRGTFRIDSETGKGTRVEIHIQKRTEVEDHV